MKPSSKITSKGQITIPAEVRAALGVREGDRVVFEKSGEQEFHLRPQAKKRDLCGMLKPYVRNTAPVTLEDMERGIAEATAPRQRRK